MLYLYFEDFIGAFVGPFPTMSDALDHIKFVHERGDGAASDSAAYVEIMAAFAFKNNERKANSLIMTPAEDRQVKDFNFGK